MTNSLSKHLPWIVPCLIALGSFAAIYGAYGSDIQNNYENIKVLQEYNRENNVGALKATMDAGFKAQNLTMTLIMKRLDDNYGELRDMRKEIADMRSSRLTE